MNTKICFCLSKQLWNLRLALSVELQLYSVKPFVQLQHQKFSNAKDYFNAFKSLCLENRCQVNLILSMA